MHNEIDYTSAVHGGRSAWVPVRLERNCIQLKGVEGHGRCRRYQPVRVNQTVSSNVSSCMNGIVRTYIPVRMDPQYRRTTLSLASPSVSACIPFIKRRCHVTGYHNGFVLSSVWDVRPAAIAAKASLWSSYTVQSQCRSCVHVLIPVVLGSR